jgi:predicted O-methyltransferase YrrM
MRWWQPSPSREIKPVPWLSPDVIQHLENLIQPDWEIIEHGSGGSTLWFAERCKSVMAFEGDPDWEQQVEKLVSPQKAAVVSGFPNPQIGPQYDLCLIDGEPVEDRARWIGAAPNLVRPGGWVVLDNANRPEYKAERKHLQEIAAEFQTFDGNEMGTLYLVTEFYHMPEAEQPKKEKKVKRGASRK